MRPQLCGTLGTTRPRLGALVSWRWEAHKHFLYQEPGGVQAKGVARKGELPRASGPFRVSTDDRVPFIRFTELASAGPFRRLEEVHLSCLSKGRRSLGGCGHHRVTLNQRCERGRWKPAPPTHTLLPPPPPAGGKVTSGNSNRTFCPPNVFRKGKFSARLPAPWKPGTPPMLRSLCISGSAGRPVSSAGRFASLLELNEPSPTWAREPRLEAGWRCISRHRLAVVRWKHGGQLQEKHQALCAPPPAAALTRGLEGEQSNGVREKEREGQGKKDPLLKERKPDPSFHRRPIAPLRLRRGCWQERAGFPGSLGRGAALSSHSLSLTPPTTSTPRPKQAEADPKGNPGCSSPSGNGFPQIGPVN